MANSFPYRMGEELGNFSFRGPWNKSSVLPLRKRESHAVGSVGPMGTAGIYIPGLPHQVRINL